MRSICPHPTANTSFEVPQPEPAVTISRIARDEVKPQSKPKNVSLQKPIIELLVSQTFSGVLALHSNENKPINLAS